jgi:hypothetical protein
MTKKGVKGGADTEQIRDGRTDVVRKDRMSRRTGAENWVRNKITGVKETKMLDLVERQGSREKKEREIQNFCLKQ